MTRTIELFWKLRHYDSTTLYKLVSLWPCTIRYELMNIWSEIPESLMYFSYFYGHRCQSAALQCNFCRQRLCCSTYSMEASEDRIEREDDIVNCGDRVKARLRERPTDSQSVRDSGDGTEDWKNRLRWRGKRVSQSHATMDNSKSSEDWYLFYKISCLKNELISKLFSKFINA